MLGKTAIIGKVLGDRDLGTISDFSSDLEFQGDKIFFPNFKSNGSLVAISAKGDYHWDSEALDFQVVAEPLKPFFGQITKLLPKVVDPFSILLERRLTGTLEEPKWEASIREIFRKKVTEKKSPPQADTILSD